MLASLSYESVPAIGLILTAILYWRGWRKVRRLAPERFPEWRLASKLRALGFGAFS
jgi:hypothetical protein